MQIALWRWLLPFIPLLGLIAFLWIKLYGFLWWDGAIEQRDKALTQVVKVEAASTENARKLAQRDREFADTTKRLSDENEVLLARLAAANSVPARTYAERMRFDKVCVSNAPADAQGQVAEIGDRPGADAVVLERTDYDILISNTVRLKAVREWGLDLINAGVAE